MSMTFKDFHHALRILPNLERDELIEAGIFENPATEWMTYQGNPWRWFIRTDDARAHKLFDLVMQRIGKPAPNQIIARPESEWHEDMGDVMWWKFPIEEPPYVGRMTDIGYTVEINTHQGVVARGTVGGWPGYHTHFTPLPDCAAITPAEEPAS